MEVVFLWYKYRNRYCACRRNISFYVCSLWNAYSISFQEIQNFHFLIFLIITCSLSLLFTHFLGQKNEEYIGYFHKFESHKNNAVWYVISSIFFIGAVCAGIICIMWWNDKILFCGIKVWDRSTTEKRYCIENQRVISFERWPTFLCGYSILTWSILLTYITTY